MPTGLKHLVTCRCILPQFKRAKDPPFHQFTVFSIVDDDGSVRVKFAQCNNCGIVHRVIDVCRSEIVSRESMSSIITIDDVKIGMPAKLVELLELNGVDLSTWESVRFIIDSAAWGSFVVMSTDEQDGLRQGKYLRIFGQNLYKVEPFVREEVIA